ncbi:NUDIX hydrolase family protein [Acidocella sp. MX-AZ02]|uniref:NUDIX hydrolase n=1 Tax=Acidocella sp. MX-AZ02 TaxID=1214225 RepID=UPI00028E27E1|nr:NUDIX domain-containing protein [Acidocella sp. MX-AZ02]EKM98772.1 Nudix hydrolase [Acidocella sp. MX-AZ02]
MLPGERLVLRGGAQSFGFVKPALAEQLRGIEPAIEISSGAVTLPPGLLPRLNELARAVGIPTRAEDFDVRAAPEGAVLGVLDRGALPSFGVIGVGVHLNGLVRRADGPHLWVARRAANKKLDPGKLDHLVAGGVPAGLSPFETLLKEAEEEAGLEETLAAQAVEVARFRYDMERPEGLRRDFLYAYDLELPEDFIPRALDGEVESFALWPLEQVRETLLTSDAFKFNVVLVLTDLLLRQGLFAPGEAQRLRAALAMPANS